MSDVRNIGARISTNPVATVRPIEGTSLFPLGQLVEAKVAAVLADGLFKFISSDGGEFELPLPAKLPEGTPVRVSTKSDGSVTVTVTGEAPDQSEAMIAAALKEAARSSAARQATMSPLFATLEELPDRPDLPLPVRQAVQTLLSMRTPLDSPPRPSVLAQAVAKSGLFTEAQLATNPDVRPPLDLKVALSSLRAVVQALVDAMPSRQAAGQAPQQAANAPAGLPATSTPPNTSGPLTQAQPALPLPATSAPSPIPPSTSQLVPESPVALASQIRPNVPVAPSALGAASGAPAPLARPAQVTASSPPVSDNGATISVPNGAPALPATASRPVVAGPGSPAASQPPVQQTAPQQVPASQAPVTSVQVSVSSLPSVPTPAATAQPAGSSSGTSVIVPPPTAEADVPPSTPPQSGVATPSPSRPVSAGAPQSSPTPSVPAQTQPASTQAPSPAAPPVQSAPPQPLPVPRTNAPPVLPGSAITPPQPQPVPEPNVRAATLALARVASLPTGEPTLLVPQQQSPPTSGHAYPVPQRPDAPPPTRGSPPVSHSPVDANDVVRTAVHNQPLEEIAPRLLADTEAAISRVSLHQMASLPDDHATNRFDAPDARWSCEIPIALDGRTALMGFVVERDGKKNDDPRKQKRWRVQAALDLPETGPLQADVQMRGTAVVAGIWVERNDVAQLLEEALPQLRDGLTAAGFDVETLNVRRGHLSPHLPPPGAFLDQRS